MRRVVEWNRSIKKVTDMRNLVTLAIDFVLAVAGLIIGAILGYLLAYWGLHQESGASLFYLNIVGPFSGLLGAAVGGMLGANVRGWFQTFLGWRQSSIREDAPQ